MAQIPLVGHRCAGCHRDDPPGAFYSNGETFCDVICCEVWERAVSNDRCVVSQTNFIHAANPEYSRTREEYYS